VQQLTIARAAFAVLGVAFVLFSGAGPAVDSPALASGASLPSVSSGARPGPDVLYSPPPAAPQLENRHPRFNAAPLLVSGQETYIDGEYLYQDYLYDDYGSDTNGTGASALSPRRGDINYPTNNARYGGNAADLVEFRIDVGVTSVLYRVTLNTLLEADSTILAIAFDTDLSPATGTANLPGDPGAPFPGTDELISFAGGSARHFEFYDLPGVATLPSTVDLEANQITIEVPRSISNPSGNWRTTVATGLFDTANGGWLRPQQTATPTTPGGAGPLDQTPAGIFNLAFRFNEPVTSGDTPPDTNQAVAIRNKAPTQFAHDINFDALDAGTGSTTVPSTGVQVRIFPSRLQLGEGQDLNAFPAYKGQLQPYSLYVPSTYAPSNPGGLVLALHSLSEHHWQYNGSLLHQQFGEQRNALVATSLSRADDGWYKDVAEYDVFEMWNDVASHFALDPDKVVITGYSMGGYATYRLGTLYPDLFGKAFSVVGPPGEGIWVPPAPPTGAPRGSTQAGADGAAETLTNSWLENARNLPYMNLAAVQDELVPYEGPEAQNLGRPDLGIDGFDQHGYRFHFLTFEAADHLALAALDYDFPMAQGFLGDAASNRNPPHVTFSYMPATDHAPLGLVHDHAYWVSGLVLADPQGTSLDPAKGTIDVFSHAFGLGDPTSASGQFVCTTPGTPPDCGPLPYTEVNRTWSAPPAIPARKQLAVTLTNLAEATIDAPRAGIGPCDATTFSIDSDSAARLLIAGFHPAVVAGAAFQQTPEGLELLVEAGHTIVSTPPDCDGDGVSDADEMACGGDPDDGTKRPERIDAIFAGVDDDGDTQVDEPLPPGTATRDCDGDGYSGARENHVYAPSTFGDQDACGSNAFPTTDPPSPIGWPSDLRGESAFSANLVNVVDLGSFTNPVRRINTDVGTTPGDRRWDLAPGAGMLGADINVADMSVLITGATANPPMLLRTRAFNGPACPWAP
jgi:pimeloyl-ACP methyl ester carboxylesterase